MQYNKPSSETQRNIMKYTLITSKGKAITFYGMAGAIIFQQAYGGVIFTNDILTDIVTV